jgi:phosphatidylserine decarboxylase
MELAQKCQNGSFINLYLSPRDYHHVHAPCSMRIIRRVHIPGALWPVNNWALSRVPLLFQKNERVVLEFESEFGAGALVMVGALNVGSMRLEFDNLSTNHPLSWTRSVETVSYSPPVAIEVGARLGSFLLGSSVLVFFAEKQRFEQRNVGSAVRLGTTLC